MQTKHIVILFDGTGNDEQDTAVTNVVKMRDGLIQDDNQQVIYFNGIGNDMQWSRLTRWFCQMTGYGGGWILNEAQAALVAALNPMIDAASAGEPTEIVVSVGGFSRGAALARHFINDNLQTVFGNLKQRASDKKITLRANAEYLFDTVASFGIPINIWLLTKLGIRNQEINVGWDFDVPKDVRTYHALSIDERRIGMTPTLIDKQKNREEVWFASDHSGVGGGHVPKGKDGHMSDEVPLRYMAERAMRNGLKFKAGFVDQYQINALKPSVLGEIQTPDWDQLPDTQVGLRDIHVIKDGKRSDKKPLIHESVRARQEQDQSYHPEALEKLDAYKVLLWNGAKQVVEKKQEEQPIAIASSSSSSMRPSSSNRI